MCNQVNYLYTCGHRSFKRFDNCPRFGQGCFGAGGSNHKDEGLDEACHDCKFREQRQSVAPTSGGGSVSGGGGGGGSSEGGTPDSNGGQSTHESEKGEDPWWEGDPWRKYRRG